MPSTAKPDPPAPNRKRAEVDRRLARLLLREAVDRAASRKLQVHANVAIYSRRPTLNGNDSDC